MIPIKFKEQNITYVANDCGDLPTYKNDEQIISCWKGTFIDRLRYLFTGVLWFSVIGNSQPPIWLGMENPFKEAQNDERV